MNKNIMIVMLVFILTSFSLLKVLDESKNTNNNYLITPITYPSIYEGAIVQDETTRINWLLSNGTKSKIVTSTRPYIILYDRYQNPYYILPDQINGVRYRYDYNSLDLEKIPQGKDIIINQT